jgi:hypothetical protein
LKFGSGVLNNVRKGLENIATDEVPIGADTNYYAKLSVRQQQLTEDL